MSEPAIPWYQSPVMKSQLVTALSALAAIAPHAAAKLGLSDESAVTVAVEGLFASASFASLLYAMVKRATSTVQPLKLSQASADAHNDKGTSP
jgi:hypothetical protein